MSIIKKLLTFISTKLGTFISRNTTIEDQYTKAANRIIDQIDQLRKRFVTAGTQRADLLALASVKDSSADSKEREIKHIMKTSPSTDVTTHAKLGLLYRRSAHALRAKAAELDSMQDEIKVKVNSLDSQREDLAVKLEFIRESNSANSMGISTVADVIETAELAKIDVDTIISRIDTFNGKNATGIESTSADVAEYLNSLKSEA